MNISDQIASHRDYLVRVGRNFAGTQGAEDLAQETLQRAIIAQHQFHGDDGELRAWLCVILRNVHFSKWRHGKLMERTAHLCVEDEPWRLTGEGLVHLHELSARIDNLSPRLRAPMRELLCGLEYEEVAERLDLPVGTVKSRLFRAREQLTAELERM